jgi:hypothetical protein
VDWNDAAYSKIQASIHQVIKVFIQAYKHKRIDKKELLDNVIAAYNPFDDFAFDLAKLDSPNEPFEHEDFLCTIEKHYDTSNKSNSLTILVYLQPSDPTGAITGWYKYRLSTQLNLVQVCNPVKTMVHSSRVVCNPVETMFHSSHVVCNPVATMLHPCRSL